MSRPAGGYRLDPDDRRTRVPGVTTIIGRYGDPGGLIHWAWTIGKSGEDYRDVSKKAIGAGNMCHDMIEARMHRHGYKLPDDADPEAVTLAESGFEAFLDWEDAVRLETICTEVVMVSKALRTGGTLDAVAWTGTKRRRKRTLLDWKTSNSTRPGHIIQLAAYSRMWNDANPNEPIEAWQSLRVGKDHADFHYHSFSEEQIGVATDAFILLREMYDTNKEIEKWV